MRQDQLTQLNRGEPQITLHKLNYVYEAESLALAALGVSQDTINIESDSDFVWTKSTFQADIAAAAQTDSSRVFPLVTIQIRDTGSARNFFNAPIPLTSFFGTGEIPFILPVSQRMRLNTTFVVDFVNFDAAATYNIRLAFIGYKVFTPGPSPAY